MKNKIALTKGKENLLLAKLIDKAMAEEGEVSKKKIYQFRKKYGRY